MGDGSAVPVAGIGTTTFKIQGRTIQLHNVLHVPTLDCSLLSITRHAAHGSGCSYLADGGAVHITFPTFSLSMDIPPNGDPCFSFQGVHDSD